MRRNGRELLSDFSWELFPGQNWAVVGPNGSGKTLLMQVLQGRLPCSSGQVTYSDVSLPEKIAQVSFELQAKLVAHEQEQEFTRQFSRDWENRRTVRQFLQEVPGRPGSKAVTDAAKPLGLLPLLDAALLDLSNGEMRKTLVARALLKVPSLLILDEPYDGLDAASRPRLAEAIGNLSDTGIQIVLVTHHLEEISAHFPYLLCIENGKNAACGKREQVVEHPALARLFQPVTATAGISNSGQVRLLLEGPDRAIPVHAATVVMKKVVVAYGAKVVLNNLDWVARRNENWAIVGPNGAGKTTLLRLIAADHAQAYANEIYLFGQRRGSGESIWEIKRKIGVLSPEFQIGYHQEMSVKDVVLSGFFDSVGLYRRATPEQGRQAHAWLERLGLAAYEADPYLQLSYGLKRMVLLSRALVKWPEMLLLDEPCQGLDVENCQRLSQAVSLVSQDTHTQIFFITHRQGELPACITHILEFSPGSGGNFTIRIRRFLKT